MTYIPPETPMSLLDDVQSMLPKIEQKALFVHRSNSYTDPTMELNRYLSEGWQVVHSCAMPSAIATDVNRSEAIGPSCLVVIARQVQSDSTPPS